MASQAYQLVMQKGPNPGKIFELVQDELTIGRDITNRIVINDPEVSRRHSRLALGASGYTIEDLGSTNGTFVDGQRLMGPHLLRPGQTIMLGEKISLTYEAIGFDPNATLVGASADSSGPATKPASRETFRVETDFDNQPQAPAAPPAYPPAPPAYQPPQPAYQPPQPAYQPPQPAYQAPQPAYQPPQPAYQAPQEAYLPTNEAYAPAPPAAEVYEEVVEEAPRSNRKLIFIGCGLLLLIVCCLVVGLLAFDTLDLYCTPPFDALDGILWTCTTP